jgi:hypothetical protein
MASSSDGYWGFLDDPPTTGVPRPFLPILDSAGGTIDVKRFNPVLTHGKLSWAPMAIH